MTETFVVRLAKEDELVETSELFSEVLQDLQYYNSLAKENELKKYTPPKLSRKQEEDPYSVLVAIDKSGKIIGFCFSHFDDFTIWLDWFGTEQSVRDKGVGTAIVKHLLETAPKRNAHKVWCDTRTSNEKSKRLLRKLGFSEIAEVKNHWYKQDFILWERFV